jgi:cell division septation protein DedD
VRRPVAIVLAAVLGTLAALATACGQDQSGLLPRTRAERLLSALDRTERAVQAGDCTRAQRALADLQTRIDNLPGSVDRDLRTRLQQGAGRLSGQVPQDCQANQPTTTTTTETTPTDTTPTDTTPTDTTPTDTTPTDTTPTDTTPTDTTPTDTTTTQPAPGDGGTAGPSEGAFPPGAGDGTP